MNLREKNQLIYGWMWTIAAKIRQKNADSRKWCIT